jgi:hypothetical protein
MARTTGPLGSTTAAGSLASLLTYSNWKGRGTVRLISRPVDPRSGLQISTRAMAKFITEEWTPHLTPAQKAAWESLATKDQVATINAYQARNLERWGNNLNPTQTPPGSNVAGGTVSRTGLSATGGVGQATITWTLVLNTDGWGTKIHRGTTNTFVANRGNCIGVLNEQTNGPYTFTEKGVPPGTWWYRLLPFRTDGGPKTASVRFSAVVQ